MMTLTQYRLSTNVTLLHSSPIKAPPKHPLSPRDSCGVTHRTHSLGSSGCVLKMQT